MFNQKKIVLYLATAFVVTGLLGGIMGAAIFSKAIKSNANSNINSVSKAVSSNSYEQAVIGAVKSASPAVVSIIISKDVPVMEQYFTNPFGDLPPDVQQFFGPLGSFQVPQYRQNGTQKQEIGGGSGFIVSSDGLILTNKHVVSDTEASYTVFLNDGRKFDAKVLARDPSNDLALIKITASGLATLSLSDSDQIQIGQTAIAIGNALGEYRNTISVGVISGLSRSVTASDSSGLSETIDNVIQTDAAINPGNSGGPLLNLNGEVIGINTATVVGAQSIGFAIPINRAKKAIESVKATGKISAPYIGIRYIPIDPQIKEKNNLSVDYGAWIQKTTKDEAAIVNNSPASKAGLKEGDIVLEINGKKIDTEHSLSTQIQNYKVGDKIILKVLRDGKEMEIGVVLEERPGNL